MCRKPKQTFVLRPIVWRLLAAVTVVTVVYWFTGDLGALLVTSSVVIGVEVVLYFLYRKIKTHPDNKVRQIESKVIWLTGLSGAGKTTLSEAICDKLILEGVKVEHLDGDKVREIFPSTGFDKDSRIQHIKRVGYLAGQLEKNGITVVASFISPYRESRSFARKQCKNFIEIYVSTPLEVCEQRDAKGLYAKARKGVIKNFTGVSDPYEVPKSPDITINTSNISIERATDLLFAQLKNYEQKKSLKPSEAFVVPV